MESTEAMRHVLVKEDIQLLADAIEALIDAKIRNIGSTDPVDYLNESDSKASLQMVLALVFIEDKPS